MSVAKFLKKAKEIQESQQQHRKDHQADGHGGGEGGHDESNWLVSYADMMTLLCGFFIMLFSMSKLDAPKYETMKEGLVKSFKGEYVEPSSAEVGRFVTSVIQEAGLDGQTLVKSDPSGVTVAFESKVFFDTLSAEVKPEGRQVLDKLIQGLADRQVKAVKQYKIVVEGHTDSRPVLGGPFPSNWELSAARASRVVRHFLDHGFTPQYLTAIGYADTRPQVPASRTPAGTWDEAALAKNRRVVVRILEPSVDSVPLAEAGPMNVTPAAMDANTSQAPGVAPVAAPVAPVKPGEAPQRDPASLTGAPGAAPQAPAVQPAAPAVQPIAPATAPQAPAVIQNAAPPAVPQMTAPVSQTH